MIISSTSWGATFTECVHILNTQRISSHFTHMHTLWKVNRHTATNTICLQVFLITPVLIWGDWQWGRSVHCHHLQLCVWERSRESERPVGKSPRTIIGTHRCLLCFTGKTKIYLPQQSYFVSASFSLFLSLSLLLLSFCTSPPLFPSQL